LEIKPHATLPSGAKSPVEIFRRKPLLFAVSALAAPEKRGDQPQLGIDDQLSEA
jgi:hypothetical protein